MNRSTTLFVAGALVLGTAGCVNRQAQEQGKKTAEFQADHTPLVVVQPVGVATLTETLDVTGDVTAGEDATIGAKVPGRLVAVYVKDGDSVASGQVIAQLDTTSLYAQLQQAQAQVSQAMASTNQSRAALAQALRNASVGPSKSTAAVRQAQAQLKGAQAQLQKALNGARPEERRQAESNLAAAKTAYETAQKELARVETLVKEGAIAGNRLDQQRNAVATARAQFENAQQSVSLIQSGTRSEDIEAAREQVRQAQEAVRTAQAQKELDPLLQDQVSAARAQVESSRSQVQSAQAQVRIAQQAIADAQIRAPFSGKIVGRPSQAGTVVGTGTAVARVIGGQGIYFSGEVPSAEVSRIRQGMPVTITVDALPGRTFHGSVAAISAQAESVGRLFEVRVQLSDGFAEVKPGMFAHGTIQMRVIPSATVVPETAVVRRGDETFVFVVRGDKAVRLAVTTGLLQGDQIQVAGVPSNSSIVVKGQELLTDGTKVKIDKTLQAGRTPANSKKAGEGIDG